MAHAPAGRSCPNSVRRAPLRPRRGQHRLPALARCRPDYPRPTRQAEGGGPPFRHARIGCPWRAGFFDF